MKVVSVTVENTSEAIRLGFSGHGCNVNIAEDHILGIEHRSEGTWLTLIDGRRVKLQWWPSGIEIADREKDR